MADYISKHEAYTKLKDLEAAYIYPPVKEAYATAARRIDEITAEDVQPVKHGYWENTNTPNQLRCSKCDVIHFIAQYPQGKINYCPNCGARMDGDNVE